MPSQRLPNPTGPLHTRLLKQALLAVTYFATATLGLHWAVPGTNATAIWIPTGLAMAAILRWGPGLWPGIFLGACAANAWHLATLGLATGPMLGVALATALGNSAEALLAGYLVERSTGTRQPFDSGTQAMAFLVGGAGLSTGLCALVGTSAYCLATGQWSLFGVMVSTWWMGDALGALLLVPLLLSFSTTELRALPRRAHGETLLAALLVLALWLAKGLLAPPLTFLYLPILVLAAFRLHPFYSACLVALLATLASLGTLAGIGPLSPGGSLQPALLTQQAFLGTLAITGLVLSGMVREKQKLGSNLVQRSRLYRTLSEVNRAILQAKDRTTMLEVTCQTLVAVGGFSMAWVGFKDETTGRLVPQAWAGPAEDYLEGIVIRWDDSPEAQGPSGQALRENRGVIFPACLADPAFAPWRQAAGRLGFQTSAAFPLRRGESVVGALNVYHSVVAAIGAEDGRLLEDLAGGLGAALEMLDTEAALKESEHRFRETLEQVALLAVTLDCQGTIVFCNDYMLRVTGWTREEVLGRSWMDAFLPAEVRAEVETVFLSAIREGAIPQHFENEILTHAGDHRLVRWNNTILRSSEGAILGTVSLGEDITEQKQAEGALRASETRIRSVFDQANDGIYILSAENRYLDANPRGLELLGYRREELLAMTVAEVLAPHEVARLAVEPPRMMSGEPHFAEWEHVRKDGSHFPGEVSARRLDDHSYLAILRDLTDRRRSEEVIRRYEDIFQHAGWGMVIADAQTNLITEVNPTFAAMHGYTVAEMLGLPLAETFTPEARAELPAHARLVNERGHLVYESEHLRKDGSRFPCRAEVTAYKDASGKVLFRAATFEDITTRKQAEEALAQRAGQLAALNDLGHSISGSNLEPRGLAQAALARIVEVLAPDLALFFLRDGEELQLLQAATGPAHLQHDTTPIHCLGHCLCGLAARDGRSLFALDIKTDPRCTWEECKRAGVKSFAVLPLKSGDATIGVLGLASATTRDFELKADFLETLASQVAVALQNALLHQGLKARAANLEQAVEERTALLREANLDLTQALEHAQMADRAKSAFLAAMSHELRTPLNSVIGFTGVLLQGLVGKLRPEQEEPLRIVQRNGRHLLELINDVLDLSKIEAQELRLSDQPFDLVQVLQESLDSLAPAAAAKRLALGSSFGVSTLPFRGDRRRLSQILLNLLSNAVKFTEHGSVTLALALEGDGVRIAVQDTGPGIAPGDLTRLFRAFEQLDSGLARHKEGTGLGLALSLRLARLMNGDIVVASRLHHGSTFTLILPVVPPTGRMVATS